MMQVCKRSENVSEKQCYIISLISVTKVSVGRACYTNDRTRSPENS